MQLCVWGEGEVGMSFSHALLAVEGLKRVLPRDLCVMSG